jgi:hypothetical protein
MAVEAGAAVSAEEDIASTVTGRYTAAPEETGVAASADMLLAQACPAAAALATLLPLQVPSFVLLAAVKLQGGGGGRPWMGHLTATCASLILTFFPPLAQSAKAVRLASF